MKEILRTSDHATLAYAQAILKGEGIRSFELDRHVSILEGGIGIFPRRIMVADENYQKAIQILSDLGIEPLS